MIMEYLRKRLTEINNYFSNGGTLTKELRVEILQLNKIVVDRERIIQAETKLWLV